MKTVFGNIIATIYMGENKKNFIYIITYENGN